MTIAPEKRTVGILGTGTIFPAYARGLSLFEHLPVVRVADLDLDRARTAAQEWDIPSWGTSEDLLADPGIDIIVNITPPMAHASLTSAALRAGKHVYVEKPLAASNADAAENLATAAESGKILGAAPDTFLGSAGQTARAAIDAGLIGRPFAGTSFVRSSKAETWHPDPSFLYQAGGGPVLDWGPYHLAALINVLGPVSRVAGATTTATDAIAVTAPHRRVDRITVETPTHATGILQFDAGAVITAMYSFDVWDTTLPHVEIYGTEGTLQLPNPNNFDGPVRIKRRSATDWSELPPVIDPITPDPPKQVRGPGVADLAAHLQGDDHRTSGEFAYHVCEVLAAMEKISLEDGPVEITSRIDRPAPVRGGRSLG